MQNLKPLVVKYDVVSLASTETKARFPLMKFDTKFWTGTSSVSIPRHGSFDNVLGIDIINAFKGVPLIKKAVTFDNVSDFRAQYFKQRLAAEDIRIGVLYSGGIDSTVIVTSMIRNFTKEELGRVTLFCNNTSFFENQEFFKIIAQHNIAVELINWLNVASLLESGQYVFVDGEPADKLWLVEIALTFALRENDYSLLSAPISAVKDKLISAISAAIGAGQATAAYELITANIHEVDAPVETLGEWFWWYNYNFHTNGHLFKSYFDMGENKTPALFSAYMRNFVPWFDSKEYYEWGFSYEGIANKKLKSIMDYKMPAKLYIDTVLHNEYFVKFKTKAASNQRSSWVRDVIVMNNGTSIKEYETEKIQNFISSLSHAS